jgi:hypothetical protein
VAAVRHPAGALAGPQTFPNSAQSAFGHAESFFTLSLSACPSHPRLSYGSRARKTLIPATIPGSSPAAGVAVEDDSTTSERPLLFGPLGQPEVGEATSLLTATNLPKG